MDNMEKMKREQGSGSTENEVKEIVEFNASHIAVVVLTVVVIVALAAVVIVAM